MSRRRLKALLRRPGVQRRLAAVAARYVRVAVATGRWRAEGAHHLEALAAEGGVVCFWHGRLAIPMPLWPKGVVAHVLSSGHADGLIAASYAEAFGMRAVTGSSRRGGAGALRNMVRIVRGGGVVAIAPDGPKGPPLVAQPGAAAVARLADARVLPIAWSATRRLTVNSWDSMQLPLPFARGVLLFGEPFAAGDEAGTARLQERLERITARADELCGRAAP